MARIKTPKISQNYGTKNLIVMQKDLGPVQPLKLVTCKEILSFLAIISGVLSFNKNNIFAQALEEEAHFSVGNIGHYQGWIQKGDGGYIIPLVNSHVLSEYNIIPNFEALR